MQLRKPLSLLLIAMLLFSTSVVLIPAGNALAGNGPTLESSHDQDDDEMMEGAVTFLVRIENVSGDSDLPTPFAPGVWVLHSEAGPLFTTGEADRGYGLEALAEDGNPANLLDALSGMDLHAGVFNTPTGADGPGPLLPGGTYEFEVKATPDTPYLSFATMFVQSNDLFVGPDEAGIALFDMDGMAMDMMHDVTADLLLWDAGTEENEEPGAGPNQAPRQSAANTGPADGMATVHVVDDGYTYPDVSALVKVTIEPVMMMDDAMDKEMGEKDEMMEGAATFLVRIENVSGDSDLPTPFAPGVWVLHSEAGPLFTTGEADRGYGLEALAEDGNPANLLDALSGMDLHAGVFNTPTGADGPGPLLPGGAYEFEVKATPDTPYLSFATMFVQSNDLFVGPDEAGIALFDMDGMAMDMMHDVTAELLLWDAGTEENEEPGAGPNQAPRQSAANTGPADGMATVHVVDDGYTYPDVSALVKVTIEPVMMMDDAMDKEMGEKDEMMAGESMVGEIMLMEDGDTPYTVVAGDTLGSIARRAYGNSKYWSVICSANSLEDCNLIHVGDELMLPTHANAMSMMDEKEGMMGEKGEMMADKDDMESDKDEMMADKGDMESDKDEMMADKGDMMGDDAMMMDKIELMEDSLTPYTVVAGDTLGSIAARAYGHSRYWSAICVYNSEVTEDCDLIHVDDELSLPSQTDADLFFDEVDAMGPDPDSDEMDKKSDE